MESLREQLAAAHEEVISDIREKWRSVSGGPSVLDSLRSFAAAVDWTEGWILALVAAQITLFLAAIFLRRNANVQHAIFLGSMGVILFAERINTLAAAHWTSFARQPYFDPHGAFTSTLLSGPLVLTMLIILVNYIVTLTGMLVEMKRKEIVYRERARKRAEQRQRASGGDSGTEGKKVK